MIHHEDAEVEETLRSLSPARPPDELRQRILRAAARPGGSGRAWKRGLAYALGLLALVALDVAVDSAQSARISQLIGDGRRAAGAAGPVRFPLRAFRERQAMLLVMMEGEGRMR